MLADPVAQRRLLELQALDSGLDQLEHKRVSLPVHARIAQLVQARDRLQQELVAAETAVSDLEADQEKSESDLTPVRERLARDQRTVDAGTLTDPKALMPMLDEIEHLKQRISTLEDEELEVMEALEAAQYRRDELRKERERLDQELRGLVAERDADVAEIGRQAAERAAERAAMASGLPADLVGLYEKQRGRGNGIGAAALRFGRCTGCQLQATATDLKRYLAAAADEVLRCEECDRILVRTEESGVA